MPNRASRYRSSTVQKGPKNYGALILFFFLPAFALTDICFSTPCSPGMFSFGIDQAELTRECLAYNAKQRSTESDSVFDVSSIINSPFGDLALDFAGIDISSPKAQEALQKYGHLIPENGKVTEADIARAPSELKAMCDSTCRERVKRYLGK